MQHSPSYTASAQRPSLRGADGAASAKSPKEQTEVANQIPAHQTRRDANWNRMFELLLAFKENNNHCKVPTPHVQGGEKLGSWVCRQRHLKNKRQLQKGRVDALHQIGFTWKIDRWNEMLELLLDFKEKNDHYRVPNYYVQDGKKLGSWVLRQRIGKRKGTLPKDREAALEDIGFVWDIRNRMRWVDMFNLLQKYYNEHGDCKVPLPHVEEGKNLGRWVRTQQLLKKMNSLHTGREYVLNKIDFNWETSTIRERSKASFG